MMAIGNLQVGVPAQISASTLVKSSEGAILGIIVSSATNGTITLYDSATAATNNKIVDTLSVNSGNILPISLGFANGLYVVIGGTASLTIVYV